MAREPRQVQAEQDQIGCRVRLQRLYGFRDVLELRIVKRLRDAGISRQQIRLALEHLASRGTEDLAALTLVCDGSTVYDCTTGEDVIDLLAGGQGVFGIAVTSLWTDVLAALSRFPSEHPAPDQPPDPR